MSDRPHGRTTSYAKLIDPGGQIKGPDLTQAHGQAQLPATEKTAPLEPVHSEQVAKSRPAPHPRPRGPAYTNMARLSHDRAMEQDDWHVKERGPAPPVGKTLAPSPVQKLPAKVAKTFAVKAPPTPGELKALFARAQAALEQEKTKNQTRSRKRSR